MGRSGKSIATQFVPTLTEPTGSATEITVTPLSAALLLKFLKPAPVFTFLVDFLSGTFVGQSLVFDFPFREKGVYLSYTPH